MENAAPSADVAENVTNETVASALADKHAGEALARSFVKRLDLRPLPGSEREFLRAGRRQIKRKPPIIESLNHGQLDRLCARRNGLYADLEGVETNIKATDDDIAELDAEYRAKRAPMIAQRKQLLGDANKIDDAIYETQYSIAKLEGTERKRRRGQ